MVPLGRTFSYFSAIPLEDADLQRLIHDPAATVPLKVGAILPAVRIVIVAYLEKPTAKSKAEGPMVMFRRPATSRRIDAATYEHGEETYVFLAAQEGEVADYHDTLYRELAGLIARRGGTDLFDPFYAIVRKELADRVHGEVNDRGWALKEKLLSKQADVSRDTKLAGDYRQQALIDTLTLYLHGLCCDIDVEAGPRQLASNHMRRRLEQLRKLLPPPAGIALFPEELS